MSDLSKRAQNLLRRIKEGRFYPTHHPNTPKAMQELIDAKLVVTCGRVEVVRRCYVPAKGYRPYKPEVLPIDRRTGDYDGVKLS